MQTEQPQLSRSPVLSYVMTIPTSSPTGRALEGSDEQILTLAEQDGAVGDRIRVRSEGRKGAVIGVVTQDGRVSLPGFK